MDSGKDLSLDQVYSDDAKRISDEMNMHAAAGSAGKWAVFALSDGRPADHTAYGTRRDAVKSQKWDRDYHIYLKIAPDGMQPKEAEAFLRYARLLHDNGFRLPDPDDLVQPDLTMPLMPRDRARQIRLLTK